MVLYQGMLITRLVTDPKRRYRAEDYKLLDGYYRQKLQQIHIVGEYANLMMRDYEAALTYVHDYFALDYNVFLRKYFAADHREEMRRGMTAARFKSSLQISPKRSFRSSMKKRSLWWLPRAGKRKNAGTGA